MERNRKLKTINGESIIGTGDIEITGGGANGREIEIQKGLTHIQWRYVGDVIWIDLIAITELKGEQGIQGETGLQGLKGDTGLQGANGLDGIQGLTGETGQQGIQGVKGDTGAQGIQGIQGIAGTVTRTADGLYALLANDTLAQNYAANKVTKLTVTANRILTTTVPPAGSEAMTIILTSGTTSRTITFGTGFKPVGTLATGTVTGRVFVIHWISDGVNLYENGRTAAMVA